MDDDEVFVCIAAAVVAGRYWLPWLTRATNLFAPRCSARLRGATFILPPLLLTCLALAISRSADKQVRENVGYIVLFTAVGGVSLAIITAFGSVIGLDALRDGLERANPAATVAVAGLWLGALALNIGSNSGEGDTIYTTLFPLALGLAEYLAALMLIAGTTGLAAAAAEQRFLSTGIRFGALALAVALPLAQAESGNWAGAFNAATDLAWAGVKVLVVLSVAWLVERRLRRADAAARSAPTFLGLLPALVYLAGAAALMRKAPP